MPLSAENLWTLFTMLLLLAWSGFFSAGETAFFNLTHRQIGELSSSGRKNQRLAASLLREPKRLLTTLLLGNMTVNVLYFASTSTFAIRLAKTSTASAVITALLAFIVLVIFGEMLPKSIAYTNSKLLSTITAIGILVCIYFFAPIRILLNWLLVVPALRLIRPTIKKTHPISTSQFKMLIDSSRQKGLINSDENQFLNAVVDLTILKVRHIMRPRVDMVFCKNNTSAKKALQIMKSCNALTLFLYAGKIDNIIGIVAMRQILLNPEAELKSLTEDVQFVPEQKNVESLLTSFLNKSYDTAVVVDEYGQTAGVVCLDDVINHLIGSEPVESRIKPIKQIGPMQYRLAGNLSIYHWAEDFGIDYRDFRFSTIAGLVTALLGKVPKAGDVTAMENLKFTVEKVHHHRIESIILSFEPIGED